MGAVCLAVLRRDGLVSLDADENQGGIVTQPFTLPAGKLYVNVDARDGELRADVLDNADQVVAESDVVQGDLPQKEIQWREPGLARLKGQTVSLRFKLRNASFYSYWVND